MMWSHGFNKIYGVGTKRGIRRKLPLVLLSGILLLLCALTLFALYGCGALSEHAYADNIVVPEDKIAAVTSVNIQADGCNVDVTSGDSVRATYVGSPDCFSYVINGDELDITYKNAIQGSNNGANSISLTLPDDINILISNLTGRNHIAGITTAALNVRVTSGSIYLYNVTAAAAKLNSYDGDINGINVNFDTTAATSTTGDITLSGEFKNPPVVSATSGNTTVIPT